MKAIIGITPLYDEKLSSIWMIPGYCDAVADAGCLPVILPLRSDEKTVESVAELCDGILLTGGQDVEPTLYGKERTDRCGEPCRVKDELGLRARSDGERARHTRTRHMPRPATHERRVRRHAGARSADGGGKDGSRDDPAVRPHGTRRKDMRRDAEGSVRHRQSARQQLSPSGGRRACALP